MLRCLIRMLMEMRLEPNGRAGGYGEYICPSADVYTHNARCRDAYNRRIEAGITNQHEQYRSTADQPAKSTCLPLIVRWCINDISSTCRECCADRCSPEMLAWEQAIPETLSDRRSRMDACFDAGVVGRRRNLLHGLDGRRRFLAAVTVNPRATAKT